MKTLATATLTLFLAPLVAQVDFGEPELDTNILNSKQHKRLTDRAAHRKTNNTNGEWSKWQVWQEQTQSAERAAAMQAWQNYGPDTVSGRIISIAFHPTDANTMLVGSASGGLWRTTDHGVTWEVLTDDYFTMGIGAVAYNPQNPNSILIATGEGYDFGNEFTAGYGIMISHDGGSTWNPTAVTATLDQSFAGMDIHWNWNDTTQVCVASSFGMYYSTDGGYNYTYVLDRLGGRMIADPQDPNRLYFTARYYSATFPGGLYISTNSGFSWSLVAGTGLPPASNFGYASVAVHPTYNHIVYVSVSQSPVVGSGPLEGLYKSTDYGVNFTQVLSGTDYFCYPPPYQSICLGWYANTIAISPTDTNRLFAGGPRLWTSADAGVTWNVCDTNFVGPGYAVHADHHQTLFHPLTGDLIDCNDGGVNYTNDNGVTWTSAADGLVTHQFYSIAFAQTDPDVAIGGTQDVGTFSTKTAHTGGWDNDLSGDAFGHAIDHTDEDVWYGTNFLNFQRIKSVDAGLNWGIINTGTSGADQWRMPMVMHPSDNTTLLSSNDNFMYKTINGGTIWSAVSTTGYIGTFEYDKANPSQVYAHALAGGTVYRSSDAGTSWNPLAASPSTPITDLAADPSNSGIVYASVGSFLPNDQLFVSTDAGGTWTNISNNLPAVPTNTVAVCPYDDQELYAGNELGVWVSQDGGTSWTAFNDGLPAAIVVEDLHFYEPDSTIRIGTYGRGYWRTRALSAPVGVKQTSVSERVRVYPNPSTGIFTLSEYVGPLAVFNSTGQFILTANHNEIDLSEQPRGIYVLKGEGFVKKLVKL